MKAGLRSLDRSCGLFLDLSVCPYIAAVIQLWFCSIFLARGTKYVPFTFGRIFLSTGKSTNVRTPKVLIYMNFKFHELWSMPKVLSNSLCV